MGPLRHNPPMRALPIRSQVCSAFVIAAIGLTATAHVAGQALPQTSEPVPVFKADPPRFVDPERRQKLARAFPDIDKLIQEFTTREHVPGAVWGVVIDGELAHVGVTGSREIAGRQPVAPETVFRIASMTKSFTAMAILRLRDEGKLSLDDPAEKYVPELQRLTYPTSDSPKITVRHLLSHSAGFPEDNPWGDQQLSATDEQFTLLMRRGIPFSNPPGIAYEYSNYAFAILGRIVTRVSGVPYKEYVTTQILKPLGMTSTTLEPKEVAPDRLAHGYRWEDEQWKEEPQLPDGAFGSMGGMLTSMHDLSRYVAAFLDAWPPRDGPETAPISRAALREMQQVWRPRPASVTQDGSGAPVLNTGGYGYGLGITTTCDYALSVAHSGGLPGFGSLMRWLPEHGVGIIAFGNRTYTGWGGVAEQALTLLRQTGGLQARAVQPSLALIGTKDAVSVLVDRWDDALANRIAAMNLFLDRSKERRQAELAAFRKQLGACRAADDFADVENPLRGEWLFTCDRGQLRAEVTLAPTMPPLVQHLEFRAATPGEDLTRRICR